ncbi:hypothetical protein [Candidatus Endomicrobiellum devescovinae]|jgi:hypothetical protein|uniref:hypothetical protein n=1 Tax=Candidatus Endomicrobiellum devescovinae TaxID=3242322 RepID=UPI00281C3D4D|nr:hypothetical protein [Endomicrobium sp.]
MKKLVLMIMFFAVAQCWADLVHKSYLSDACVPEPEQQQTQANGQENNAAGIIPANDPQVNQMVAEALIELQLLAVQRGWQQQEPQRQPQAILIEPDDNFGLSL